MFLLNIGKFLVADRLSTYLQYKMFLLNEGVLAIEKFDKEFTIQNVSIKLT